MVLNIELLAGPGKKELIKQDIDKNIIALERAIKGTICTQADYILLADIKSILEGIRTHLPTSK